MQVGHLGKYLPGPWFVVDFSKTMFPVSYFLGCTRTWIPDCQHTVTSFYSDCKITTHILTAPVAAVMGSRSKRWLEMLHSDLGTLSTPTTFFARIMNIFLLRSIASCFVYKTNIFGVRNFYIVSSSVFLSFADNFYYFVRDDLFYWYCNAGIYHFGIYDIIHLHNKRQVCPICATRLKTFSSFNL